jgi:hypothetical protein
VDDDEEWGWGEGGSTSKATNSSVEMTPSSGHRNSNLHYRSSSPGNGGVDLTTKDRSAAMLQHRGSSGSSGNNFGGGSGNPIDKPRGMSVKKTGMKNPLHATTTVGATTSPASAPVRKVMAPPPPLTRTTAATMKQPPDKPVVKKLPPSSDDFFEQMGFNAKPSFKSTTTTSNNLAAPAPSSGNAAAADWGDDGDLDDLLDD